MDRFKLSHIDEELDSSDVAALRFLCRDVVSRKRLEDVRDAKKLFLRLEEKGLLENDVFLAQLLQTIHRADLLSLLETDSRPPEETDANPMLSEYRVMLYRIHEDMTKENLKQMKFLLKDKDKFGRGLTEKCNTALDVFAEMEKIGLLSNTNTDTLHRVLSELDVDLVRTLENYTARPHRQPLTSLPHVSIDQRVNDTQPPTLDFLSISETQPSNVLIGESVSTDAEIPNTRKSVSELNEKEYYRLSHNPRGWCVVINNEKFKEPVLKNRRGTQEDTKALREVFTRLGFKVVIENDLTADEIRTKLQNLSKQNFLDHDALVVCVLSHGENGLVYGTDAAAVYLRELTKPFTSDQVPTLAGKPKLFFIQACQGDGCQKGALPCPPRPRQEEEEEEEELQSSVEEDAGPVRGETIPSDCDFLLGMATVPECKSFRNTSTGSIYIQELCRQLMISAASPGLEDIISVLIRVNREVSRGEFKNSKQMPQPNFTFTKKLVLKFV